MATFVALNIAQGIENVRIGATGSSARNALRNTWAALIPPSDAERKFRADAMAKLGWEAFPLPRWGVQHMGRIIASGGSRADALAAVRADGGLFDPERMLLAVLDVDLAVRITAGQENLPALVRIAGRRTNRLFACEFPPEGDAPGAMPA